MRPGDEGRERRARGLRAHHAPLSGAASVSGVPTVVAATVLCSGACAHARGEPRAASRALCALAARTAC